jgi:acetyl esterase/lipase
MTMPPLDDEFAHLADFDFGLRSEADLAQIRSMIAQVIEPPPPIDGVVARRVTVGTDPEVVVETYTPEDGDLRSALLWFHGGGYLFGSAAMDGPRLQGWAKRFGCLVASVEYSLAPEHPFPRAHHEALQALDWLTRSADELGVDARRIGVGGASAGGGIAAGLALAARDRGMPIAGQLLFYPMIDDRQMTPSSQWDAPVWSQAANTLGWSAYLGEHHDRAVPGYAAPARAERVDGLPPTMVIVGGADRFHDEDLEYAVRLTHSGVPTEIRVYAGTPHGFDLVAPDSTVSRAALSEAERWLAKTLGGSGRAH